MSLCCFNVTFYERRNFPYENEQCDFSTWTQDIATRWGMCINETQVTSSSGWCLQQKSTFLWVLFHIYVYKWQCFTIYLEYWAIYVDCISQSVLDIYNETWWLNAIYLLALVALRVVCLSGIILCMGPVNERWRYNVTSVISPWLSPYNEWSQFVYVCA